MFLLTTKDLSPIPQPKAKDPAGRLGARNLGGHYTAPRKS
jgi:hypothetical protein